MFMDMEFSELAFDSRVEVSRPLLLQVLAEAMVSFVQAICWRAMDLWWPLIPALRVLPALLNTFL